MSRWRKRPVEVEAVQLRWDNWSEMCDHTAGSDCVGCYIDVAGKPTESSDGRDVMGLRIPTLEGEMLATEHDWVIRGVKGELYPCKPDIFDLTYEAVS